MIQKIKIRQLFAIFSLLGLMSSSAFAATAAKQVVSQKKQPASQMRPKNTASENPNLLPEARMFYLSGDYTPGRSYVSTGPYLGVPFEYSGSNLIINSPSINEDVSLLKLRANIYKRLAQLGLTPAEDHAHLLLSGIIEGQAVYKNMQQASGSTNIDVTTLNLDAYVLSPSPWVSGLLEFAYDNDIGATSGVINSNQRVSNSRVFVNKAFITLGNFLVSPFYASLGQMYVPFGLYSSSFITNPMTKSMARTKARALLVGYQPLNPNTFYSSAYIFKGDSYASSNNKINNGGINLGVKFNNGLFRGDVGGGVIANMADSLGMQHTGSNTLFGGFGSTSTSCTGTNGTVGVNCGNEGLVHRVPAYDIRGIVDIAGHWDLIAEYIMASTRFNPSDMTYNSHGARPRALDAEASYSFLVREKPTSIGLGYGATSEVLAIGLPSRRYSFVVNTSLWPDTLQSFEFRHDVNYAAAATSSGSNAVGPGGTGLSGNTATLQFDMYF